jgi:hypothetical protein
MTVAARDLQKDPGQVITFALVKVRIVGGCFQSLLKLRDGGRRLSLLLLSALSKACTCACIALSFFVSDFRRCLNVHRQLHRAGCRLKRHHLVDVLAGG